MRSADGTADPRLAQALQQHQVSSTPAARAEVLAALLDAQVLVPLAAVATGHETAAQTGLRAESGAELSLMLLESGDGARALPVFTDLHALRRWRLDARPVPLTGQQAASAARDEGAGHLLLDQVLAVEPDEVAALAAGWVPVPGSTLSSRTAASPEPLTAAAEAPPELVAALRRALAEEPLRAARLLEGQDGLVLGVAPAVPLDAAGLAALAQRVVGALGSTLPAAGLQLQLVPRRGPGLSLLAGARWRR